MPVVDLVFGTVLIGLVGVISYVDMRRMVIPDGANLALACSGLIWQATENHKWPLPSLAFAGIIYAGFWLLRTWHRRLRRVAGLGKGDVKMAGAAACWFSPWNTPLFLSVASLSALIFVASAALKGRELNLEARVPFGPFLGMGLVITWLLERSGFPTFIPNGI